MRFDSRFSVAVEAAVVAVLLSAAPAAAQSSKSAPLASELVRQLAARNLQNIAAKDPDHPGYFAAASHIPGMLLVVYAKSAAPDYVEYVLGSSRYDEVYASLNGASVPEGKLFVQDMGADGLAARPENGGPTDIAYREVTTTTVLNGDWKKQGLTERQYGETFQTIDQGYSRALSLLLGQLGGAAGPGEVRQPPQ